MVRNVFIMDVIIIGMSFVRGSVVDVPEEMVKEFEGKVVEKKVRKKFVGVEE